MKFSSKLALVASASLLSLSAFAADPSLVGTAKVLSYDDMVTSFTTDMQGMDVTSVDRGAFIKQDGSEGATALIIQNGVDAGSYAYINQASGDPSAAMIIQAGTANSAAMILQK